MSESDFESGVDLDLFASGDHFSATDVHVEDVDYEKRSIVLRGPVDLQPVHKRTSFRADVELPVALSRFRGASIQAGSSSSSEVFHGTTVDVGSGGLCLETAGPVPAEVGQNIRLSLDLEGHEVVAIARTAWIRLVGPDKFALGLAFVDVDMDSHDRLYRFLYDLHRQRR